MPVAYAKDGNIEAEDTRVIAQGSGTVNTATTSTDYDCSVSMVSMEWKRWKKGVRSIARREGEYM